MGIRRQQSVEQESAVSTSGHFFLIEWCDEKERRGVAEMDDQRSGRRPTKRRLEF